jgi:hypothetical protein
VIVVLRHLRDYKIGICCFSAKHSAIGRKSKDWSAWNQDNVSECGDMSIRGLLFQCASTIKIQLSVLTTYHKLGENANHYTNDAVLLS